MNSIGKILAAAALAIGSTGASQAAIIDFGYSGNTVATLTTSGNTSFVLNFSYAPGGASAFINDLYLVGPSGTFSAAGGQSTSATASYSGSGLGDGNAFNWHLNFPTSNGGGGAARFNVGESYSWGISGTSADAWSANSMIHINAFLNDDSIKLTGCVRGSRECAQVPEPTTLALLGMGLLGIGLARRRKSKA